MKAYIVIKDDKDEIVAEAEFDAGQPYAFRQPSSKSLTAKMPRQSEQEDTGYYEWYGFSFQPHVRATRPNGWKEPPPTPWAGTPVARPVNGQTAVAPFGAFKSSLGGFNSLQKQGDPTPASSPNPISRG